MTPIAVGGLDVRRIHVGGVAASRVHVGTELAWSAITTRDFSVDSTAFDATYAPFGITRHGLRFYVVFGTDFSAGTFVVPFDSGGAEVAADVLHLWGNGSRGRGITVAGGVLWVLGWQRLGIEGISPFNLDGTSAGSRIELQDDQLAGVTFDGSWLRAVRRTENTEPWSVSAWEPPQTSRGSTNLSSLSSPRGITRRGSNLLIIDGTTVLGYTLTLGRAASLDFDLTADNGNPSGLVWVPESSHYYVTDSTDRMVYVYDEDGVYVGGG